jgi:hypothetical protein
MTTENRLTLSPTMVEAMDYAKRVGGVLHRYRGVCWSRPGAITDRGFPVVDRIPNPTVGALLKRGWLRVMMSAGSGRPPASGQGGGRPPVATVRPVA